MKGWRFVILEQNPDTGANVLTAKGQILAPIGSSHWLVQFYGEKSAYCKTLSAESLEALTLFPNDQQLNVFLAEQFPPPPPTPEELKALADAKALAEEQKKAAANGVEPVPAEPVRTSPQLPIRPEFDERTPDPKKSPENEDDTPEGANDDDQLHTADPEPLVVVPEVPDKPALSVVPDISPTPEVTGDAFEAGETGPIDPDELLDKDLPPAG